MNGDCAFGFINYNSDTMNTKYVFFLDLVLHN